MTTTTDKYGPNTPAVEELLARIRTLTQEEAEALAEAWRAAQDAAQDAAWEAAWPAAQDVAQDSAWEAVRGEVWDATRVTARVSLKYAVWDAALALLVRDLIDESTAWNQKAFDILTGPWRSVIGPLPDDADKFESGLGNVNLDFGADELKDLYLNGRITNDVRRVALDLLEAICDGDQVLPFVSPTDERGVEVTWTMDGHIMGFTVSDANRVDCDGDYVKWKSTWPVTATNGNFVRDRMRSSQKRLDDLIAELRKKAKEWEDESSPHWQCAEYVSVKNRCGEDLNGILDEAEQ